jgi:hypothetical protein
MPPSSQCRYRIVMARVPTAAAKVACRRSGHRAGGNEPKSAFTVAGQVCLEKVI